MTTEYSLAAQSQRDVELSQEKASQCIIFSPNIQLHPSLIYKAAQPWSLPPHPSHLREHSVHTH